MSEEFVSVAEAAEQLRVSGRRIRQLIDDKELQARRIGNSWAIPLYEIYQRKRRSPRPGRPYEPENVWKLAAFADAVACDFLNNLAEESSWRGDLRQQQDRLVNEVVESIRRLCEFDAYQVVDNPSQLSELRRLLSRSQLLSQREELLAGWMDNAVHRLRDFESRAQVDSLSLAQAWLHAFGADPHELEPDPRLLRSLRNRLMHRLGDSERYIAALRNRFDQAVYFLAHPSLIAELARDSRLVYSGEHAAAQYGLDLISSDSIDAYVGREHLEAMVDYYALQEVSSFDGNAVLRIVDDLPHHHPHIAPRLFVAVDLLEEDDPRCQIVGSELLEAVLAALSLNQLFSKWKYSFPR